MPPLPHRHLRGFIDVALKPLQPGLERFRRLRIAADHALA